MTVRLSRVFGLCFLIGTGAAFASPTLDGIDASSLRPGSFGASVEGFQPLNKVGRFASEASAIYTRNRDRVQALEKLFAKLKEQVAQDLEQHEIGQKHLLAWNIPAPEEAVGKANVVARAKAEPPAAKMGIALQPQAGEQLHEVKRGDTLRAIARTYYGDSGMYRLLVRANGLHAESVLFVGQLLKVPGGEGNAGSLPRKAAPVKVASRPMVKKSEVLVRPARMPMPVRSEPVEAVTKPKVFASVNQAKRAAHSRKVPSQDSLDYGSYEFKLYTVKQGDSLTAIAERFYGDAKKHELIKSYNRIAAAQSLKAGDRVLIPLPKSQEAERRYLLAKKGIFLDR